MKRKGPIGVWVICAVMMGAILSGMRFENPVMAMSNDIIPIAVETVFCPLREIGKRLMLQAAYDKKQAEIEAEWRKKAEEASKEQVNSVVECTREESEMMAYIIQQEVRGATLKHKRILANIIVNRVKSDAFPNTIEDVIFQKNQFTSTQNYYSHTYKPDANTRQAVKEVLSGSCEDLSQGALYFYAPKWTKSKIASWFENRLTFLFELEGHRFFK
ncbi:MAG: cell wall hydrolase [Oscillospiraceae bacterium]